jgi:hypothetical protein
VDEQGAFYEVPPRRRTVGEIVLRPFVGLGDGVFWGCYHTSFNGAVSCSTSNTAYVQPGLSVLFTSGPYFAGVTGGALLPFTPFLTQIYVTGGAMAPVVQAELGIRL